MTHYTDEDVHVAWCPGGRHFKKRKNLNFIDYDDPNKFFIDALKNNKGIVCLVTNIQRLSHYSSPRYQLCIRVGVRRYDLIAGKTLKSVMDYWRLWRGDAHPDSAAQAAAYITAPFVSTAVLPCTKHKIDNELRDVNKDVLTPRVILAPPFGVEYAVGLDKSLKSQDLADWAHNMNAVVQKVYKQFVDPHGELV